MKNKQPANLSTDEMISRMQSHVSDVHFTKKEPTPDDVDRHLRPIRAEYVRKVRVLADKKAPKKNGCFRQIISGSILLSSFAVLYVLIFGARTKRDGLKRWCAQSLNSMAKAILDINNVYEEFKGVHDEHAEYLASLMVHIARDREGLVSFCQETWGLNEQQIMSYI
jgi:hypothetical protein